MNDSEWIAAPGDETESGLGAAALAAVEIMIWQLVQAGWLEAKPLAQQLARYGRLYDVERRAPGDAAAAETLYALARLALGAGRCAATEGWAGRESAQPDTQVN